jgi:hypothetical protein
MKHPIAPKLPNFLYRETIKKVKKTKVKKVKNSVGVATIK